MFIENRIVKVLVTFQILGRVEKAFLLGRLEDEEIKHIYLFSVLYICGDRSSIPVILLENMSGKSILL